MRSIVPVSNTNCIIVIKYKAESKKLPDISFKFVDILKLDCLLLCFKSSYFLNPLVPDAHYSERQDKLFSLQIQQLEVDIK